MSKKEEHKKIIAEHNKRREMAENPNQCFCDEPLIDHNKSIGETSDDFYSKFDFNHQSPFKLQVYICQNCNKEFTYNVLQ